MDATKATILVIDDEREVCDLLRLLFETRDYRCLVSHNGVDGLLRALTEQPDVIVLDIMMPEVNGYDLLFRLRENEGTRGIPVVVMTGITGQDPRPAEDWRAMLEVAAFFTKPVGHAELLGTVEKLLAGRPGSPAAGTP